MRYKGKKPNCQRQTDVQTDGQTDGQTKVRYREAWIGCGRGRQIGALAPQLLPFVNGGCGGGRLVGPIAPQPVFQKSLGRPHSVDS